MIKNQDRINYLGFSLIDVFWDYFQYIQKFSYNLLDCVLRGHNISIAKYFLHILYYKIF